MTTINELARRLQSAMMRGQFTDWRKMYTGKRTTDGITLAGADTGKVWVRAEEDSREETQVWGSASRINLPVWVGPNIAGELEIKTLEQTEAALTAGAAAAASLLPPILPDGNANVLIGGRQFKPGRMRVSDLGGLYVYVEPFHTDGAYWPGGDIELTAPSTSNMQAWIAVALNPADGLLYDFQGTEYATPVVMSEADLPNIAITSGYIPVGAVVLQNGQTTITGEEVWADFHYHYAQVGSDIAGVVILAPASDTRNTVQPAADHPALILKNNAGQTDNPFQAQTSAGAVNVAITPLGGLIVNEQGADADTRIEGDADANLVFVDASTDRVGIGTNAPAQLLDVDGTAIIQTLMTDASTELTIASGAITVTQTFHRVDTEADAASDNLDTINGGTDGQFLVIRAENAAREVVVTNSGNIATSDGNNVSLDEVYKFLLLIYDGNRSVWNVVGGSGGGGAGTYYQTIEDAGTPLTQRSSLNFIEGTNVTLTIADDSGNDRTNVTITASGSGGSLTVEEVDGTPSVSAVDTIVVSNGTLTDDGSGQVTINTAGTPSAAETAYYETQCALLEPLAIEPMQRDSFTYAVSSSATKFLIASWQTRLGSVGRLEVRDPGTGPLQLRDITLYGTASGSTGVLIDPTLPTYTDAKETYFERINTLNTSTVKYLGFDNDQETKPFLPGAYGAIILQVTTFDLTWTIFQMNGNGWNTANEIGDSGTTEYQRLGNTLRLPVSKYVVNQVKTGQEKSANAGRAGIAYILLPSTWGAVTDSTTYDFRDDFMGSAIDTGTDWNRTQSTTGNVEIDTQYQWLKMTGNGSWGTNGLFSQTGISRANGKVFLCDVQMPASGTPNLVVGWHDGAGYSYSDFAHGIDFTVSGGNVLQVFENGTSRGTVGSGWTAGYVYRVRITLTTTGATYEIQGGAYGTFGSTSWTDITPGTTSSATATLYAGATISTNTSDCYVGDIRVY